MKVSIIGGAGRVGSNAAYALQARGLVPEIALVDVNIEAAEGEALDLRHGASLAAPQRIYAGGPEVIKGSDIVLITAGLRRKPDESRLELINRNVAVFRDILEQIRSAKLNKGARIIVVSNPVDILTQVAVEADIVPPSRVIGLGTLLDTTRFRSLLAEHFDIDPTMVDALILGEHGDTMVPIWSSANINGTTISSFPGYNKAEVMGIFDFTKRSGAEVLRLKGGAGYAVGMAIAELVNTITMDRRRVLPVSTMQNGVLGINGICLSLPTIMGRDGVISVIDVKVSPEEKESLWHCADVLKETMSHVA